MKKHSRKRRLYTMTEMVIVIFIIGLLTAIATPMYMKHMKRANINTAKAQIRLLEQAVFDFQMDMKRLPDSENGLRELRENVGNDEKWDGPYLKQPIPQDPWGQEYIYKVPGESGDFDIISYGKDRQPGGSKENADISNNMQE